MFKLFCVSSTGRPVQETVIQSSVSEPGSSPAGAHPGRPAVQGEAAQPSHRAAAGTRPIFSPGSRTVVYFLFIHHLAHGLRSCVFQQFSDQHPESASGIKLTMAQLYLIQGTLMWSWFDAFRHIHVLSVVNTALSQSDQSALLSNCAVYSD